MMLRLEEKDEVSPAGRNRENVNLERNPNHSLCGRGTGVGKKEKNQRKCFKRKSLKY